MTLEKLRSHSEKFIALRNEPYQRYFIRETALETPCSVILGDRGIGKTTTLIQYLLQEANGDRFSPEILYIQADHFLMTGIAIYEVVELFAAMGGKVIAIDEIHKYPNWSQELKSIYDSFPGVKVIASGSSALEAYKGTHDLARRAITYRMQGLSFREYLELNLDYTFDNYALETILENHTHLADSVTNKLAADGHKILPIFHDYLQHGYYPYQRTLDNQTLYKVTLEQSVHITIESDLSAIHSELNGASIKRIKQLMGYIANSVPFTPQWSTQKSIIGVTDDRTIKTYFKYLEDAQLIRCLSSGTNKMSKLQKPEKIYLYNTNLMYALGNDNANIGTVRETYFANILSKDHALSLPQSGDFKVDDNLYFEVGGRSKDGSQVKQYEKGFVVSDNIEVGTGNKVPLWLFGFLY